MLFFEPSTIGDIVQYVKDRQNRGQGDEPDGPDLQDGPVKGHSVQISEKERRVSDRRQRSAHVAHNENEKYNMVFADPGLVDSQKRTDQQHGRPCRPEQIRDHRACREQECVDQRSRMPLRMQIDSSRRDKQRSYQSDEAEVVDKSLRHAVVIEVKRIIGHDQKTQAKRDQGIVVLPPAAVNERDDGDGQQKDDKGENRPGAHHRYAGLGGKHRERQQERAHRAKNPTRHRPGPLSQANKKA